MVNIAQTLILSVVLGLSLAASAWQGLPSNALVDGPMMAAETSQQAAPESVALQPQTVNPAEYGIGRPMVMSDDAIELVRSFPQLLVDAMETVHLGLEETMS